MRLDDGSPIDETDLLNPVWLTAALRFAGNEVTIRDVSRQRIGTGQMGVSYRLRLEVDGDGGDFPSTIVAKLPSPDREMRPLVSGAYRLEANFYSEIAGTVAIHTPGCYLALISDDSTSFVLLLEDLAPAVQGDQLAGCGVDQAEDAVVNLAGLHGPRWCDPTLAELPWLSHADEENIRMLAALMGPATTTFVERYGDHLEDHHREVLFTVAEAIPAWMLARQERFAVLHGDYRLDNLLFPADGSRGVAAVDWQTLDLGLPTRDLAYFLATSLQPDDRRRHEEHLVAAYHGALLAYGVDGYSIDECFDDYRFSTLHGPLITVLGAAYSSRTDRGDQMFLAMTHRSCDAITALGTLDML